MKMWPFTKKPKKYKMDAMDEMNMLFELRAAATIAEKHPEWTEKQRTACLKQFPNMRKYLEWKEEQEKNA
jgi:hypothetical protein